MFSKLRVSLFRVWRASFGKHLLLTNTVSSGGFFVLGDAIQQRVEMTQNPGQKFDVRRCSRLGLVGLTQGPPHHYWYVYLDKFLPGKAYGVVMKKILADQVFAAPFFAITFIFGAGLMEGNSLSKMIICNPSILELFGRILLERVQSQVPDNIRIRLAHLASQPGGQLPVDPLPVQGPLRQWRDRPLGHISLLHQAQTRSTRSFSRVGGYH